MSATALGTVVLVVLVAALAASVSAALVVSRARARRMHDLRALTQAATAVAEHARRRHHADEGEAWAPVVDALRRRFGATRAVLVPGGDPGEVIVSGVPLPAGPGPLPDLAPWVAGRPAACLRARAADAEGAEDAGVARGTPNSALAARGAVEVLVAPLRPGAEAQGPSGAIEVHDPTLPRLRRRFARRRDGTGVRGELTLLATVARQVAVEIDNARLEARLRRGAYHDALTGLLNRAGFVQAAAAQLDGGGGGAVALIDIGLLDQVNDTLGHASGERFVAEVAARLAAVCASPRAASVAPGARLAARLEGDTFAVVVAGIGAETAHRSAEEMRAQMLRPYPVEGLPFEAPVAVGVAAADAPSLVGETGAALVTHLLARADVALASTRDGVAGVRCYEPSMSERADRRLALIRGFGPGLVGGQIRVHFQPTVSLGEHTVLGVEALARWEHPELGALLPDEFVPVLEATGQIGALTAFVLDESLAAARRWLDRGMRLSVAVNVSVGVLEDAGFPETVARALARHDVPAELLTLEVTESGMSSDRSLALPVLRRLHALGCLLAVDDFGTGQSSLAHLRRLPVDLVKIDKSFVLNMGTERGDVAVVRAIVEMGHTLGLRVVAEGVENPGVRAALADMGCDIAQGYLVSRPLPARCLDRWLDSLDVRPVLPGADPGPRTLIA